MNSYKSNYITVFYYRYINITNFNYINCCFSIDLSTYEYSGSGSFSS